MGFGIPPLAIKILLGSTPLKSRVSVRILAADGPASGLVCMPDSDGIDIYIYIYTYIHNVYIINMYMYINIYIYIYIHISLSIYIYMHIYIYTYVYMYTHVYTHIHIIVIDLSYVYYYCHKQAPFGCIIDAVRVICHVKLIRFSNPFVAHPFLCRSPVP